MLYISELCKINHSCNNIALDCIVYLLVLACSLSEGRLPSTIVCLLKRSFFKTVQMKKIHTLLNPHLPKTNCLPTSTHLKIKTFCKTLKDLQGLTTNIGINHRKSCDTPFYATPQESLLEQCERDLEHYVQRPGNGTL